VIALIVDKGRCADRATVLADVVSSCPNDAPRRREFGSDRPDAGFLTLVATGASNKEIGRELNLAEATVKLHVRQILRKIGARNRSEAASIATRASLL
jgi:hypothetical protein